MSASTRRSRITIRPYAGSADGPFHSQSYGAARGTYWCRVSQLQGDETIEDGKRIHVDRMLFEFADEVTVLANDLLVDESSVQWKIESISNRTSARQKIVRAYRTGDDVAATLA